MALNISAAKRGFLYNPASKSLGIYVDGVKVADYVANIGRTYYVNNILGSSGADGLSWGSAMDEVSTAITASETYRQLGGVAGGAAVTTNDYVANTIVIQGTSTIYTGITDLGERCYIIGNSAGLMRDGGSGQVRIGATDTDGCDDATNARGNTVYNVQFLGGGNNMYAFRNTAWIQRSRFQDVTFMQGGGDLEGCFYAQSMSGTIIERCHFANNSAGTAALYGLQVGAQFSDNLITDCTFAVGSTALLHLANSIQTNSIIEGNYFVGDSAVGAYNLTSGGSCAALMNNTFLVTTVQTDRINWANRGKVSGNFAAKAYIDSATE